MWRAGDTASGYYPRPVGSFYTQVLVRADAQRCVDVMRSLRRPSYVIPPHRGITVVCDKQCEGQDMETLDSVAATLGARLEVPTAALLNHDDDWLVFRLFERGRFVGGIEVGHTPLSLRGSVAKLREIVSPGAPLWPIYAALLKPRVFQLQRHAELVAALGLPQGSLGVGYQYIARNDVSVFLDRATVLET
jgi:hypothetical protein